MDAQSTHPIEETLRRHVKRLAGDIGPRHAGAKDKLDTARDYVQSTFASLGLSPTLHSYPYENQTFDNVEATLPGQTDKLLIIGAHYDSVSTTPGADDNASGVAGLLTLAELLTKWPNEGRPEKTIRFVAFANEEGPFYGTDGMGSLAYARMAKKRKDPVKAVLILEMLGYYSEHPGSQTYPPLLKFFYPDRGNFIAVVSNLFNFGLVWKVARRLRKQFPVRTLAGPSRIDGVDSSDHWAFWQVGWPAVMITDTAFYRNPFYHTPEDKAGTLDYRRMAGLVQALAGAVIDL